MDNIQEKILALIKMKKPKDPLIYMKETIKSYAMECVNDSIKECKDCGLHEGNIKTIPIGDINSKILIIGESVSKEQFDKGNKIDIVLNDADGDTLSKAMNVLGANIQNVLMINSINCFPCNRNNNIINKRIASVKERNTCKKYIDSIIDLINPNVIITLGSVATNALSSERVAIMESRGQSFEYKGYYVVPTYHPGFFREMANKFDMEMMNMYKDQFLTDLYQAFNYAKEKDDKCNIGDVKLPF